jgi:TRAP-type mannitol/chloroaromatic compound transport system permease small subunit
LQWYLFGAVVLLGAAYTLKHNEHIRIDIINSRLSKTTRDWIDVIGHVLFLGPLCFVMLWLGWPFFMRSFTSGDISASAGGLILWPAKMLIPLGFFLLSLQGLSELIKRVAIMRGLIEDPHERGGAHAPEGAPGVHGVQSSIN